MRRIIIMILLCLTAGGATAQSQMQELLQSIEKNNKRLISLRQLTDAMILDSRTGNTLGNPSISYDYMWGSPSSLGKIGELNVVQPFEFPTVYAKRSRLAKLKTGQLNAEYAISRQEILLDAQLTFLQLIAQQKELDLLMQRMSNTKTLVELYEKRVNAGEANALELNNISITLINITKTMRLSQIDIDASKSKLTSLNGGMDIHSFVIADFDAMPALPALEDLTQKYMNDDPRILSLKQAEQVAEQQIKVSQSESLPNFEVGYRRESGAGEKFNGIKMGMSIPIFESKNKVKRAKAEAEAVKTQLADEQTQIDIALRQLHNRAKTLLSAMNDTKLAMSPDKSISLFTKAFNAGQISKLEYYMEIETIYELQSSMITTEHDYRAAVAQLNIVDL